MRLITRLGLAVALALTFGTASAQQTKATRTPIARIEMLDVGQGYSILFRSPEGKTTLIDAGPSSRVIVDRLKARGIKGLDLVVVSHHHADYYRGMAAVVREFRPSVFLATASAHTTSLYLRLLELVRDQGIQAIQPTDCPRKIERHGLPRHDLGHRKSPM
jgi:beta-lactamase superfamily II metal-dependent hydrolase